MEADDDRHPYDRTYEIQVVDIGHDMASVVVHSDPFTEYLHLARFDDGWKIVNAFYRRNRPNQVPMIEPVLRLATLDDVDEIDALMKSSTRDLFPILYDDAQTEASVHYIAAVDRSLIQDGTYFAMEANGELVACGGWSRRDKLYTGSGDAGGDARPLDPASEPARLRAMFVRADWTRRGLGTRILEACEAAARAEGFQTLALMSTLPGLPLYERFGFQILERVDIPLPNGTTIGGARMVMQLPSAGPLRQPPSSR
ncbi:MAG: GNAT family N-acetyltransferase [Chloroflexi bacterium]|nr:MAG: GNAT family N-acetyltransferase [Chloroflexota bacterium]